MVKSYLRLDFFSLPHPCHHDHSYSTIHLFLFVLHFRILKAKSKKSLPFIPCTLFPNPRTFLPDPLSTPCKYNTILLVLLLCMYRCFQKRADTHIYSYFPLVIHQYLFFFPLVREMLLFSLVYGPLDIYYISHLPSSYIRPCD